MTPFIIYTYYPISYAVILHINEADLGGGGLRKNYNRKPVFSRYII